MSKAKNINAGEFLLDHALVVILLLAVVTAFVQPNFLSVGNLASIMRQFGALSFVALGLTFAIISGFIDLSIPGMVNMAAVLVIWFVNPVGQWGSLILTLCFGISAGLTTVAGIVNSSFLGAGNANYGDMTAMIVNCAVVVGGTSMAGGIWQSAVGVLFFSAMEITLQNIVPNAYVIQLIQGLVIVTILFLDSYDNKRKRERV